MLKKCGIFNARPIISRLRLFWNILHVSLLWERKCNFNEKGDRLKIFNLRQSTTTFLIHRRPSREQQTKFFSIWLHH
jgi:hypothetical protein